MLLKMEQAFIETETLDWFEYEILTTLQNNNRSLYVIAFDQKKMLNYHYTKVFCTLI